MVVTETIKLTRIRDFILGGRRRGDTYVSILWNNNTVVKCDVFFSDPSIGNYERLVDISCGQAEERHSKEIEGRKDRNGVYGGDLRALGG